MKQLLSFAPLVGIAMLAPAVMVQAEPYALPPEKPVKLPAGEGAALTAATCAACHSLDYVTTQPRGKGEQFWKDSVTKMVNVYGAPVAKDDAATIAAYLGRTFGPATPAKR
jgi:cytochrome c5